MLNKIIYPLLLIISIIYITGCDNYQTMTCNKTSMDENNTISSTYIVKYKENYVHSIESVEKVTSQDQSKLDEYEKTVKSLYEPFSNLEAYSYKIENKNNSVTIYTNVNYDKVDVDALKKIDSSSKALFTNDKVNLETIKSLYKNVGVECK